MYSDQYGINIAPLFITSGNFQSVDTIEEKIDFIKNINDFLRQDCKEFFKPDQFVVDLFLNIWLKNPKDLPKVKFPSLKHGLLQIF